MDVRPTNIPIVQARELRMDNLFELEDGSVAILDYESAYKKANFTKYGRYIMDVIDRYLREEKEPDIHMMVLYTADIEEAKASMERTACRIQVEASYLAGVPSEEWMEDARKRIEEGNITDEMLMHLVILPLTYKGEEKNNMRTPPRSDSGEATPQNHQHRNHIQKHFHTISSCKKLVNNILSQKILLYIVFFRFFTLF